MNWWLRQPTDETGAHAVAVAPSVLSADFSRLSEEIEEVERAGADLLHLDVMDGHFVPNLTFGPMIVAAIRRVSKLKLVSHLMIEKPENLIEEFAGSGSDVISIHLEASSSPARDLELIRSLGIKVGLAVNPDTPFDKTVDYLDKIDLLLVMSVFPGHGGQKFMPDVLGKVERARAHRDDEGLGFAIEVDGGIKPENARLARDAGADILVAGTAVFKSPNYKEAISAIRG